MLCSAAGVRLSEEEAGATRRRLVSCVRSSPEVDELRSLFMVNVTKASRRQNAKNTVKPMQNSCATAVHEVATRMTARTSAKKLNKTKDMCERMVKSRCGRSFYTHVTSRDACPERALTGGYPMVYSKFTASVGSFAPLGEADTQPPRTLLRKCIPVANRCEFHRILNYPPVTAERRHLASYPRSNRS